MYSVIKNISFLKYWILLVLLNSSSVLFSQKITVIGTNTNGVKDTVQFGFTDQASLGEDPLLGEQNLFGTPVDDYEIRILQRDEANHECSLSQVNGTEVTYPENFDTKINLRDDEDTTLANRLFEIWFSDYSTDSIEIISEINMDGFLSGYSYVHECDDPEFPPPVAILVVADEVYHIAYKVTPGLWVKEFIFILNDQVTTSISDDNDEDDIFLYPNPATDHFIVEAETFRIDKIIIQNLHGQNLQTFNRPQIHQEISMTSMASGLYVVHISFENGTKLVRKVIKK